MPVNGSLLKTLDEKDLGTLQPDHTNQFYACVFSPDDGCILSASSDHSLWLWDAATGQPLRKMKGHTDMVRACTFSPDGRFIVSASKDKMLRVWDRFTAHGLYILAGHTGPVTACAFSPDGQFIVSSSGDKTLRFWNSINGEMLECYQFSRPLVSLGLHPWMPQVVCGDRDGAIYRFEIPGIEYGPIHVIAVETGQRIEVHCPACQSKLHITEDKLGSEMTCAMEGCGLKMKINPFVIHMI